MLKNIALFLILLFPASYAVAFDCSEDEKLVLLNGTKIGSDAYKQHVYANSLTKVKTKDSLFEGGDWHSKNYSSNDLNIYGTSMCLDTNSFEDVFDNLHEGSYCWCKVTVLDNYKVFADWVNLKQYDSYSQYSSGDGKIDESEKKRTEQMNTDSCMRECSKYCQSNMFLLMKEVKGYYICDKALYKTNNKNCVLGKDVIGVQKITVFDDIAEIIISNISVPLQRDTSSNDMIYVGKYNYKNIYLKIDSDSKETKYMIGKEMYSLKECL